MAKVHSVAVTTKCLLSVLSIFHAMTFQPALASKTEPAVDAKGDNCGDGMLIEKSNGQTAHFAQLPNDSKNITVVAESANVVIKRSAATNVITLSSNCPRDWSVQGSLIRQAAFSDDTRKGSSLMADDLGSRAIANGHIYLLPQGGMKGLQLSSEGVKANGEMLAPLKGSDIPCNCSGADYLEIVVPQDFAGDLKIGATGKSTISIGSWKDGAIDCVLLGNAALNAEKLTTLAKATFNNKGNGAANISDVDAKIFVANVAGSGSGSIRIKNGKAEMSNATVEGNGTIELHGNFKQLKQSVNGTGKIEVKP